MSQLFPPIGEDDSRRLTDAGEALVRWLIHHLGTAELVDWTIAKLRDGRRLHAFCATAYNAA